MCPHGDRVRTHPPCLHAGPVLRPVGRAGRRYLQRTTPIGVASRGGNHNLRPLAESDAGGRLRAAPPVPSTGARVETPSHHKGVPKARPAQ